MSGRNERIAINSNEVGAGVIGMSIGDQDVVVLGVGIGRGLIVIGQGRSGIVIDKEPEHTLGATKLEKMDGDSGLNARNGVVMPYTVSDLGIDRDSER